MSYLKKHSLKKTEAREAELAQRRGVASSDEKWREEEDVSPPDVPIPSTSGVRIREATILLKPVKVVARPPADLERKKEDDIIVDLDGDTVVEEEDREEDGTMAEEREERESDSEPSDKLRKVILPMKRGRGRPAIVPGHAGQFTGEKIAARALVRKERVLAEEQLEALDPATELRRGPRLAKARREELELLIEFRETSAAGLTAVVTEQVALLRRVAQRCTNLNGTTIKALWDATVNIMAASAALNLRAQSSGAAVASPEWEDMREELRQLRVDMSHMRASNNSMKEDLARAQKEQEKLRKELEGEREERSKLEWESECRRRECSRRKCCEERNGEDPPRQLPPRGSSPVRLRPRGTRRVIVDESEEEEEVGMEVEVPACPPSPVPDCQPQLGEIIPPAFRPPLKGVREEIEAERPFEGPRDPPDTAPREANKALTMEDMGKVLETMLPRLLAGMGISPKKESNAPLPSPDPGSAPKGHTGPGEKGGGTPEGSGGALYRRSATSSGQGHSFSSGGARRQGTPKQEEKGEEEGEEGRWRSRRRTFPSHCLSLHCRSPDHQGGRGHCSSCHRAVDPSRGPEGEEAGGRRYCFPPSDHEVGNCRRKYRGQPGAEGQTA